MAIYLVQHGDAVAKDVDPDRPLSDKGRDDVRRMAAFLSASCIRVDRLIHSGKTRARETAEILQQGLGGVLASSEVGIAPNDPTDDLKEYIESSSENLMVVGHLPFMGRMVSHLITGTADAKIVTFEPGSVVLLERAPDGPWTLNWMVRPSLLGN